MQYRRNFALREPQGTNNTIVLHLRHEVPAGLTCNIFHVKSAWIFNVEYKMWMVVCVCGGGCEGIRVSGGRGVSASTCFNHAYQKTIGQFQKNVTLFHFLLDRESVKIGLH